MLDTSGEVLDANENACRLLGIGRWPSRHLSPAEARNALKRLLGAGTTRFTVDQDAWVVIPRDNQRQLILHAVPISGGEITQGPHTVVIMIDLNLSPQVAPATLQKIFRLTLAEARLAARIAMGATLMEVANESEITMSTARTQLASIFTKTQTRRQGELVALLARVAILP